MEKGGDFHCSFGLEKGIRLYNHRKLILNFSINKVISKQ
jgi:hypothetical protein